MRISDWSSDVCSSDLGSACVITAYGFSSSGNCHKVRLLLEQLGRDYRWIEVDSSKGQTRTPEFLAKNPNGRVPVIDREDGSLLAESTAILCWLADGNDRKSTRLHSSQYCASRMPY